ncbi:MAG: DUF4350 domain-containing protein [Bacteroidota bacterium]
MKSLSTNQIVIGAVILLFIGAVLYGILAPKPIDWDRSFSKENKSPFGGFLAYEWLPDLLGDTAQVVEHAVLDQLAFESYENTSYLLWNGHLPINEYEVEELLRYVAEGNQAILLADDFHYLLMDTLGLYVEKSLTGPNGLADSVQIGFRSPQLPDSFRLPKAHLESSINFEPELLPMGSVPNLLAQDGRQRTVLLELPYGEGSFVFGTLPMTLTNYYVIDSVRHTMAEAVFSHVNADHELWWDEHYKQDRIRQRGNSGGGDRGNQGQGLFAYLWSQKALRWALLLLIGTLLLYAIFEAKRTQRIIPVVVPPPNTTLDFTETVGRLYFQSRDHHAVAVKKIKILLGYIRSHYYLKTHEFSDDFIRNLAGKSGIPEHELRELFHVISRTKHQTAMEEAELIDLNTRIERFYREGAR